MMEVDKLFDIKGNTAVITGASAGLGEMFAETLASKGANLAICARREEKLKELARRISKKYGIEVMYMKVDVTDEAQVAKFFKAAYEKFKRIDILVNNAGTSGKTAGYESALTFPREKWEKEINLNLTSLFITAREAVKYMAKRKYGKIVNMSSVLGLVVEKWEMSAYYASKGGIINLTRGLAVEFATLGITVNAIAPGTFPSEATKEDVFGDPKTVAYIKSRNPMRRTGEHDDLKGVLLLLVSHASNYITGQTIAVDGGWSIW